MHSQTDRRKTSIQLLLEAQQHKKYAQTTPLDDGVSSLLDEFLVMEKHSCSRSTRRA
jgi:hypothetical protein